MALSINRWDADGIQSRFNITFGYLSRSHVFAFVDDRLVAYKWISEFQIELLVIPQPNAVVTIRRLTDRANRITTYTDGQTLLADSLNVGDLQTFYIAQEMIDQIEDAILAGDVSVINPGGGYITAQWIQDQLTAGLAAAEQFDIIDAAIQNEAAQRAAAIANEALFRGQAIASEANARAQDVLALTQADLDAGQRLTTIESDLNDPATGALAKIASLETVVVDLEGRKANASTVTALGAELDGVEALVYAETAARVSQYGALATEIDLLEANVGSANAAIAAEQSARITADEVAAGQITALTARVGTTETGVAAASAAVVAEASARATGDTANSQRIDLVQARTGGDGSPIPDWDFQDPGFWNQPTGVSFAQGSPFTGNTGRARGLVFGPGTYDFYSDYFQVERGAAYEVTTEWWNGSSSMTGYLRPLIHVPGVVWWSTIAGAAVNDIGAAGQAGDIHIAGTAGQVTQTLVNNGGVSEWQFRLRGTIGGVANVYVRFSIRKLPQYAAVTELREALTTGSSSIARLLLAVNTATNVASIEAAAFSGDGVWNGSAITLQADLIRLLARNINFGTNTVFEDTFGSLHTTNNSRRLRMLGPFGASGDLVMWYGPTSVALNSETKTNGYFSFATDGKVYYGNAELGGGSTVSAKVGVGAYPVDTVNNWYGLGIISFANLQSGSFIKFPYVDIEGDGASSGTIATGSWYWRIIAYPTAGGGGFQIASGDFTTTAGGAGEPLTVTSLQQPAQRLYTPPLSGAVSYQLQVYRIGGGSGIAGLRGTIYVENLPG